MKTRLLGIIQPISRSIYDPTFYREIRERPLRDAFRHLAILGAISGIVMILFFIVPFVVRQWDVMSNPDAAITWYPKELVVTLKNGEATANVDEPFLIDIPEDWRGPNDTAKFLAVIRTQEPFSTDMFDELSTYIVVAQNATAMRQSNGQLRVYPYTSLPDATIDYAFFRSGAVKAQRWFLILSPLIVALIIVFVAVALLLTYAIRGVIFALVALLIGKLTNTSLTYRQAYVTVLYATTLPILYDVASDVLWHNNNTTAWWAEAVLIAIVLTINFLPSKKASEKK